LNTNEVPFALVIAVPEAKEAKQDSVGESRNLIRLSI
jgi:hypothetical protein